MDAARRLELQTSLQRELERHAAERGLGPTARVAWLLDQLENYVERWLGLRAADGSAIAPASDDLFGMIEIGADVTSGEVRAAEAAAVMGSWQTFLTILAELRAGSSMIEPWRLAEALAVVRSELQSRITA
jgi:hypothetical protein